MRKGEGGGEGGQVEEVLTRQLNKLEKRTAPKIVQSVKCEPAAAVGSPVRLSSYRHSISTLTHTAQSALCSTQIAIQSVRLPDCLLTAFSAFSSKGVQKKHTHLSLDAVLKRSSMHNCHHCRQLRRRMKCKLLICQCSVLSFEH